MVHIKTYIFRYFHQEYLVLFTMVSRNSRNSDQSLGNIAGSLPPCPLRFVPCIAFREREAFSPFSPLRLASNCMHTYIHRQKNVQHAAPTYVTGTKRSVLDPAEHNLPDSQSDKFVRHINSQKRSIKPPSTHVPGTERRVLDHRVLDRFAHGHREVRRDGPRRRRPHRHS